MEKHISRLYELRALLSKWLVLIIIIAMSLLILQYLGWRDELLKMNVPLWSNESLFQGFYLLFLVKRDSLDSSVLNVERRTWSNESLFQGIYLFPCEEGFIRFQRTQPVAHCTYSDGSKMTENVIKSSLSAIFKYIQWSGLSSQPKKRKRTGRQLYSQHENCWSCVHCDERFDS